VSHPHCSRGPLLLSSLYKCDFPHTKFRVEPLERAVESVAWWGLMTSPDGKEEGGHSEASMCSGQVKPPNWCGYTPPPRFFFLVGLGGI
jgi:hypothetical protein